MGREALEAGSRLTDAVPMTSWLLLTYLGLAATLVRSLLIAAKVVPSLCRACGKQQERRDIGDEICRC
jgi:hypothetical protein